MVLTNYKEVIKVKRFEIRLDKELHDKLREESFVTGKSMHQIMIELLEKYYKNKEEKKD